ncbi:MAG: c-type cytochrome [Nannocystaceae bacterium]|nr:cytochrome c [bacterium]
MMMLRKMPALLFAGSLAFAAGCDGEEDDGGAGGTDGEDRAATILSLEGDASAGAMVFSAGACATAGCHGPDGVSGMASPSLDASVPSATDTQIVNSLLNGKGSMPAQSNLSDQELADVLAYVTDTFG